MTKQDNLAGFSEQQLRAVLLRDKHLIVTAGAGSGKTRVLTHRFASLVSEGKADVDQILTLTFTRKAAGEMKARIYRILLDWGQDNPHIEKQITTFDQAQISTIDSFCAQILKQSPQSFGLNPDFIQDKEAFDSLVEQTSLVYLKKTLNHTGAIALRAFLGTPDAWMDLLKLIAQKSVLGEKNQSQIGGELFFNNVKNYFESAKVELASFLDDPEVLGRLEDKKTNATARKLDAAMKLSRLYLEDASFSISRLDDIEIKYAGGEIKNDVYNFLSIIHRIRVCSRFLQKPEEWKKIHQWIDGFTEEICENRKNAGVLSFNDIASLAIQLLTMNKEIREYYKGKFNYILIDEFQDNNQMQKKLLFLLSEKRGQCTDGIPGVSDLDVGKLFFVGDVKQSIYGFRDADVRVLKNLRSELSSTCEPVSLEENYRSSPELVRFYNHFFESLFSGVHGPWDAAWEGAREGRKESTNSEYRIFVSQTDEGNEARESLSDEALTGRAEIEAYKTAELICRIVADKKQVADGKGGRRDVRFEDIAVLVRHLSHQYRYEKAFKLFDIPFEVNEPRNFFLEPVASDFCSYFQILLYPDDRLSWAAVLRSPFVGLDDKTFVAVMKENHGIFDTALLTLPGMENYKACFDLYTELRSSFRSLPLTELVRILWVRGGYQFYILSNPAVHSCLDFYYYLQAFASDHQAQGRLLGDFMAFLHQRIGGTERIKDLNVLRPVSQGVKIMTIHGSKGLEFPVVILSDTDKGDGHDSVILDERDGSLVCTRYLRDLIDKNGKEDFDFLLRVSELKEKELAELKRLIYVAMTRACDHLYVFALSSVTKKADSMGSLIREAWIGAFGTDGITELPRVMDLPEIEKGLDKIISDNELISLYEKNIFDIKSSDLRTVFSASMLETKAPVTEPLFCEPEYPWLENEEMILAWGQWIHDNLRAATDPDFALPKNWPGNWAVFEPEITEETAKMISLFYSSELWKNAQKLSTIKWERPLTLKLGLFEFNGRLDFLAIEDRKAIVVDFKTDRQAGADSHRGQLSVYASALKGVGFVDVEAWVYYCRNGKSVLVHPMSDQELKELASSVEGEES